MPKTPDYFAGKTIIITGAGSGIGRATALIFAREHANVVCADINEAGARDTAAAVNDVGSQALAAARSGLYPVTGQPRPEPSSPAFLGPDPGDRSGGHWLLDLWAANRHVLQEAGVPATQIHVTGIPTGPAGHDTFFSDRAARPCGRLALVARLGTR